MLLRNFVTLVKNPYFATTRVRISTSSAPVTSRARPSSGALPALTRPRPFDGCTITRSEWARRLALPDAELVQNPNVAPSKGTHQTAVATGVPSRLKVVNDTYFSALGSTTAT